MAPPRRKPFKFENLRLDHLNFKDNIEHYWIDNKPTKGSLMYKFQQRPENLKSIIKTWKIYVFGNTFQAPNNLKQVEEVHLSVIQEGRNKDLIQREAFLQE
jgi:hypothetical protein